MHLRDDVEPGHTTQAEPPFSEPKLSGSQHIAQIPRPGAAHTDSPRDCIVPDVLAEMEFDFWLSGSLD